MTSHITVRLIWHDRGWDGHICDKPKQNVFCTGQFSLQGDYVKAHKDVKWETDNHSKFVADLGNLPPCTWTINAFSQRENKHVHVHPLKEQYHILPGVKPREEKVPAYSTGTWSYDKMYDKHEGGLFPLNQREKNIREYFEQFEPKKSLVFFYLNFDNPVNPENKKYVLVGISRLKEILPEQFFKGLTPEEREKFGELVWSRLIVHDHPNEGVVIPYQEYIKNGHDCKPILFEISGDFARQFKYVSREVSDDIATELVERMIVIVKRLKQDNLVKEDWDNKLLWLNHVLSEVWKNRGLYPGLGGIHEYLKFENGTTFVKEFAKHLGRKLDLRDEVFKLLTDGNIEGAYEEDLKRARKKWEVLSAEKKELLRTLAKFELSTEQIQKIVSEKKELTGITSSLRQMKQNPYLLCEEYIGEDEDDIISFHRIDNGFFPDRSLGTVEELRPDDIRRLRALIVEKLRSERNNGNCFLHVNDIFDYVEQKRIGWRTCSIDLDTINADRPFFDEKLVFIERNGKTYGYLKSVYDDERLVENRVKKLFQRSMYPTSELNWKIRISSKHDHIPEPLYQRVLDEQSTALENSYRHAFSIITGAAGTGKTQVVDALIRGIRERDGRQTFLLLAPTGKAATRLTQRTPVQAKTIHRALMEHGWLNPKNYKFTRDGRSTVAQNIIVDEASMVDLELMAQLFRAIDWNRVKRFVLVGDPNQLPPIGFGRPFLDIINFLKVQVQLKDNIASLTINCRQLEENSLALKLAEIFGGTRPYKNYEEMLSRIDQIAKAEQRHGIIGNDLEVHFWKNENDIEAIVMKKLEELLKEELKLSSEPSYEHFNKLVGIPNPYAGRGLDYFQILTPYRGYYYGTAALNVLVQEKFRLGLLARRQVKGFTTFDKVIQIQNTTIYHKGGSTTYLFNGQLGYIKALWQNGAYVKFLDIGEDIGFTDSGRYPIVENLELGYAISVHKAQGSDFEIVFLVLPKENKSLLSRELVYTALTRSKKKVVLFLQDDIEPLLEAMDPAKSVITGRNTSTFIFRFTSSKYFENDLIHYTANGEAVRSKSEVIIANELRNHGLSYEYERILWSKDGSSFRKPDFTVYCEGEEYYWEHLGMTDDPEYMQRWEAKKRWYEQNGFADRLIVSEEDAGGLDSRKIVQIIEARFK